MNNKAKKILTYVFLSFVALIIIGFAANWYLTQRLESYLNEKLSEAVSDATDGFYKISFDSLSVGLFNGELSIRNIEVIPDSLIFDEWAAKDSLPNTYFKIHVKSIEFKGVNLTWRFNYQKLNFDLFEIQSPNVEVFDAYSSDRFEKKIKYVESKTLYEMASPYFDAISVKKMNMENASVSYIIEDPIAPSIYALSGINFYAYQFRLDENSSKNGKLLYFDDFEFSVEKPQVILNTSQLLLTADTIRLNTIDSIIQIKNVSLEPRDTLWQEIHQMPDTYIDAKLKAVDMKGAKFSRIEGLNYFDARTFDIIASDIKYFTTKIDSAAPSKKQKSDTIIQSLSLHRIISPILHSVAIQNIGIERAKFKYTQTAGDFKNIYTLEELNIHAGNFLIDSLADVRNRYWHSENFSLDARGINGALTDKNHNISIAHINLDAMQRFLRVEDIKVSPISTHTRQDYMSGSIKLIALEELVVDKGIEADVLKISNPYINYFKVKRPKTESSKPDLSDDKNNVFDLISPFLNFFSIKRISLLNADLAYNDKITGANYRLRNLNAFVTNFLINDDTRKASSSLFTYDGFGLSFRNFDNYLPGKDYRLQIARGGFSTLGDGLRLQNVKIIPQDQLKNKHSGTYLSFETPLIEGKGGIYNPNAKSINITSFNLHTPKVDIVKIAAGETKAGNKASPNDISSFLKSLNIGNLNLNDADISYLDRSSKDSLTLKFNNLLLKTIVWSANDKSNIGEILLDAPRVSYLKHNSSKKAKSENKATDTSDISALLGNVIGIGKFDITDIDFSLTQPDVLVDMKSEQIAIGTMQWSPKGNNSSFVLNGVNIKNPKIDYHQIHNQKDTVMQAADSLSKKDIYDLIGSYAKNVSVNKFDITGASINYTSNLEGQNTRKQKINETNLNVEGFSLDANKKTIALDDVSFNTKDIRFPIMNGFYTIEVGEIDLSKKKNSLTLDGLYMIPAYSKTEFAYKHPRHKDWFNLSVGNILISDLDLPTYLSEKKLIIKDVQVNDVILENFKNQQIEIQHNIMPMIYEGLQKAPLKLSVDNLDVHNFSVVYEELPKNSKQSGKIFFTEMNGRFTEFTNIVSRPNQFIKLNADGKLMGTGHFTATWMLPVDEHNDNFILNAHLKNFDLRDMNQLITPMATAEVTSGMLNDLTFETHASSKGATVDMLFLYNDLNITVFKDLETKEQQKVYTYLANKALKTNNPDKEGRKPRQPHITIVRDPYHSTFNYLWQILQPPVVESVGVSQGKQKFVKKVSKVFSSIKNFFSFGKKKKNQTEKQDDDSKGQ
ncbi:DUF748 domain-containing protein [Dysgonomonas sp. ZJ709]|uniref:DUF748 domain-containing protein n=1 Tax=Dysgonomonas sp. ZJ709 TaxID=2709797 RepID=UPI0013EC6DCB|nr:DUF748 domain-containing protein [Dysgonomonas sp. ZJ709]